MATRERTDWAAVLTVYLAGVLAAAGLGQVAAVLPLMQDSLHVGLSAMGWAVSGMTVTAAVVGLPAGLWVQRLGARRALLIAVTVAVVVPPGRAPAAVADRVAGGWSDRRSWRSVSARSRRSAWP